MLRLVDEYLLGGSVTKSDAIAALLAYPASTERAAPYVRALEAVGERAADEALIALRLVYAGQVPTDAAVRRVRGLANVARAVHRRDDALLAQALRRDGVALGDLHLLTQRTEQRTELAATARAAYERALGVAPSSVPTEI